jgi:hypothetical protein
MFFSIISFFYLYILFKAIINPCKEDFFFLFCTFFALPDITHKKKYQQQQFAKEKTSNLLDRKKHGSAGENLLE